MILATMYAARAKTPLAGYLHLQVVLMRRYVAQGGCATRWCERHAVLFRERYGWMLTPAAPAVDAGPLRPTSPGTPSPGVASSEGGAARPAAHARPGR